MAISARMLIIIRFINVQFQLKPAQAGFSFCIVSTVAFMLQLRKIALEELWL